MTVKELNETLTKMVELLKAADAKKGTITGLEEFIETTESFGNLNLKAFVKLAETGRTPPAPRPTPQPRTSGRQTGNPDNLATEVKGLYDRVADVSVTEERIRQVCSQLSSLSKDGVLRVSEGIGLTGLRSKTKGEIISQITNRLLDRKGAAIRGQLIERPESLPPT